MVAGHSGLLTVPSGTAGSARRRRRYQAVGAAGAEGGAEQLVLLESCMKHAM